MFWPHPYVRHAWKHYGIVSLYTHDCMPSWILFTMQYLKYVLTTSGIIETRMLDTNIMNPRLFCLK